MLLKHNSKALTAEKKQLMISVLPGFGIFSLPFFQGLCQPVQSQAVWEPFSSSVSKEHFPIFFTCMAAALPTPLSLSSFTAIFCNKARPKRFRIYFTLFLFRTCCICKCLLTKAWTWHFIEKCRITL